MWVVLLGVFSLDHCEFRCQYQCNQLSVKTRNEVITCRLGRSTPPTHSLTHSLIFYAEATTVSRKLLVICQNPVARLSFTAALCMQIITLCANKPSVNKQRAVVKIKN